MVVFNMNVLLVDKKDRLPQGQYLIDKKNDFNHLIDVLKVKLGSKVLVGELNGKMGFLSVIEISETSLKLAGTFDIDPPRALPIKLIIALPRPKMLKRILRSISMLGVKEIYLINTSKVEKSFWYSKTLEKYEKYLLQGLSQSKDTIIPKLYIKKRFKPFVEDELSSIIKDTIALLAHPNKETPFPYRPKKNLTLAIGPEGGFSEYEVEKLEEIGFKTVHCGERILRMETAVISLLSQHYNFIHSI